MAFTIKSFAISLYSRLHNIMILFIFNKLPSHIPFGSWVKTEQKMASTVVIRMWWEKVEIWADRFDRFTISYTTVRPIYNSERPIKARSSTRMFKMNHPKTVLGRFALCLYLIDFPLKCDRHNSNNIMCVSVSVCLCVRVRQKLASITE